MFPTEDGGECGLCGGPLVKNPHPDAGKPSVLTEVGYVWVCPPCITKAMTGWANRCHEAEEQIKRLSAAVDEAQLRSIEARNPGIDMDDVRRIRAAKAADNQPSVNGAAP